MPTNAHTLVKFAQEERNGLPRRRVITWSKRNVDRERLLLGSFDYEHLFFSAAQCRDAGLRPRFAAQLDCEKFYQQLSLLAKRHWAVAAYNETFLLRTIPTGSALAPIVAQALLHALARLATNGTAVTFDCCIDNLRLLGDSLDELKQAWTRLRETCSRVGLVIGDFSDPSPDSYTYLGVFYDKVENRARLKDSTAAKLRATVAQLNSKLLPLDHLSAFGKLMNAVQLLRWDRSDLFYIVKFIRRVQEDLNNNSRKPKRAWDSARPRWQYLANRLSTEWVTLQDEPTSSITLFTDASLTGWGVVVLTEPSVTVYAGRWSPKECDQVSINVLETMAVLKAAQRLPPLLALPSSLTEVRVFIDNTTAKAWVTEGCSSNRDANKVVAKLQQIERDHNLRFVMRYVKSARNPADAPSRGLPMSTADLLACLAPPT